MLLLFPDLKQSIISAVCTLSMYGVTILDVYLYLGCSATPPASDMTADQL